MDSITQAALGAAVGEGILGRKIGYRGAILGAIIGTLPDLDVMMLPFLNELQKVSLHRGYSHSILFCFIGGFFITWGISKISWLQVIRFRRLFLFSFLTLITHVLLDSFTTYGTQLFLPFTDNRVSFDSIGIIDPVYTIPLLLGLGLSLFRYERQHPDRSVPNHFGLVISSLYLMFTLANKQHIQKVFYQNLEKQEITYYRMLTVPVAAANSIWYGVVADKTHLYLGKYSMWKDNEVEFESFPINDYLLNSLDSDLVDRLKWFAQDFYTVAEFEGKIRMYNMQCDMQGVRYFGEYKAPTAFYYEIDPNPDGQYSLTSGMHMANKK